MICLDPLDILPETNALTLDMLRIYVSTIGTYIQQIANEAKGIYLRERVDTLVIPVRLAGVWLLYFTQRTGRTQIVVRLAMNLHRGDEVSIIHAVGYIDIAMRIMGRGAM